MTHALSYGSTFTGILGLDRAFEAVTGGRCAWACERSAFCREIIWREHPTIPIIADIHSLDRSTARERVDAIIGGFPCQDVSDSGKRVGLEHGERTGLWFELARVLGDLRPGIVFLENVRGLLRRGFEHVLADLARLGFDAEWTCLRASDVGAPHRRERVFILATTADGRARLADAYGQRLRQFAERNLRGQAFGRNPLPLDAGADAVEHAARLGHAREGARRGGRETEPVAEPLGAGAAVADADDDQQSERSDGYDHDGCDARGCEPDRRDALGLADHRWPPGPADQEGWARWDGARPSFRREPHGLPRWVDRSRLAEGLRRARLRALGNAVVAQQAAEALHGLIRRSLCDR